MQGLAGAGNRAGTDGALEPTVTCSGINKHGCWLSIVIFIRYNEGALKTKADISSGVNFISVALKHKQK